MRPLSFRSEELRSLLLRNKIATLDELKQALGTSVNVTVFRKLKPLAYLTSYSHCGRYYTLHDVARFDDDGLWSQADVWFSRFGTLLASAEAFVNRSLRGFFADELARACTSKCRIRCINWHSSNGWLVRSSPAATFTRPRSALFGVGNY